VSYNISYVFHPYIDTRHNVIVSIFHNRQYIDLNKMETSNLRSSYFTPPSFLSDRKIGYERQKIKLACRDHTRSKVNTKLGLNWPASYLVLTLCLVVQLRVQFWPRVQLPFFEFSFNLVYCCPASYLLLTSYDLYMPI
jgi:hypothetical protein